jgi:hypothetical protein
MAVIRQMEVVTEAIDTLGLSSSAGSYPLYEKNKRLLPTKKGLLTGQLELISNNNYSAEAVYALNQKYGYNDADT